MPIFAKTCLDLPELCISSVHTRGIARLRGHESASSVQRPPRDDIILGRRYCGARPLQRGRDMLLHLLLLVLRGSTPGCSAAGVSGYGSAASVYLTGGTGLLLETGSGLLGAGCWVLGSCELGAAATGDRPLRPVSRQVHCAVSHCMTKAVLYHV